MRLGTKLILYLSITLIVLMAVFGYLNDRWSRRSLREELAREGRGMVRITQIAMEDYLRDRKLDDMRELADKISLYERVYGVRVFNPDGTLRFQSESLEGHQFRSTAALQDVLERRVTRQTQRKIEEDPVVTYIVPLVGPDSTVTGALQLVQLESFVQEDAAASRRAVVGLTTIMILIAAASIILLTWFNVTRRTQEMVHSFREVGSGDLHARVPVRSQDELGHLAQEFNAMCERLEATQRSLLHELEVRRRMEESLRNAEHLASFGRFAAGLAHEIGTPLNVISGHAEALERTLAGNVRAERKLGIITAQINRIARTMRGILDFANPKEPKLARVEVPAVLQHIFEFLEERFREKGIRLETALAPGLPPVAADPDQIAEVFLNLAMNAVEAMPTGGTLRVGVDRREGMGPAGEGPGRPCLCVVFEDTGVGIDPGHLKRVFDPFFTTRAVGEGTGLGLSISYGIVKEHGGWIEVESEPGKGTRVLVYLPVAGTVPGAGEPGEDRQRA